MTPQEFHIKVDELFLAIEQWLESENDNIDFESHEGMLIIVLPQGQQLIFSRQTTLSEIWLASPKGAFHFHYTGSEWRTHQGQALLTTLIQVIEALANIHLDISHFGRGVI